MRVSRFGLLVRAVGAFALILGLAPAVSAQWGDEFNGSGAPSTGNWTRDLGGGGFGNNELQCYTDGSANANQTGGYLNIQARVQGSCDGRGYSSARLKTQGIRNFGPYGRIEARLQGPMGQGLWPAFWTLGSNITSVPWPGCGEIDIMEHINTQGNTHGVIHWNGPAGYAYYTAAMPAVSFGSWNNYAIDWTSARIQWQVNGGAVGEANIAGNINSTEEFHRSMFIILNLAVGGNWPGAPNGTTPFPANYNIDWVRVNGGGPAPTATSTSAPRATATARPGSTATATPRSGATATPTTGGGTGCTGAWATGVFYAVNATASYGGRRYSCRQAHTSQVGWEPPSAPALWLDQGACSGSATATTPPRATATATPRSRARATATSRSRATATSTTAPRSTPTATATPAGGWTLVWSDEFNGSGAPNSANWNYHVGNGYNAALPGFQGWGNGEWEWYRPENSYQSGGNLVIRADYFTTPTNIAGRDWYQRSGRITTQGKRSWTYGKIEARIQMPNAIGSWPAFWMMGNTSGGTNTANYSAPITYYDSMATTWASCGEIDITEHKNSDTVIYNNIFWDLRTGVFPWTAGQNANYGTTYNVGNVAQFHVYSLEWDATFIRWFTDGVQTHVIDITPATLEEFHKPMYLILNLAVGGAFPAADPNIANFPLYMYVDYVRVSQK